VLRTSGDSVTAAFVPLRPKVMLTVNKLLAVAAAIVAATSFADAIHDEKRCEPERFGHLEKTEIVSTSLHEAGLVKDAGRPFPPTRVPKHCRVNGVVRRVPGSEVNFEVWLPTEGWNGKLIGVGNGGYGGDILMQGGLAEAIQRGYAAVSTDTDHSGTAIDAAWACARHAPLFQWSWSEPVQQRDRSRDTKRSVSRHCGRPGGLGRGWD